MHRFTNRLHPVGLTLIKDFNETTGNRDSLSYTYSTSGHLKSKTYGPLNTTFSYDNNNNLTGLAGTQPLATQYDYDSLNRPDTVTVNGQTITYEYYPNGLIQSKTFPALSDGSVLKTEYSYDNAMRLKTLTNKKGSNILSSFSYDYDDNSNIVAITADGQQTTYDYDPLNRLEKIHKPGQDPIVYQYDTRGNRTQVQGQETPVAPLVEYQYDAQNRLIQAKKDNQTTTFSYDPTGMRVKKDSAAGSEKYVYDQQDRIVAITDGNNNVKSQIVWGPDAPLVLKDVATGKLYYFVTNGHGDVIQLIDEIGVWMWGEDLSE